MKMCPNIQKLLNQFTLKLFLLILTINLINAANILGIFHYPSKSHHILGSALLKGLAKRGHNVTMISPFSTNSPMENSSTGFPKGNFSTSFPIENYTNIQLHDDIFINKEDNMKQVIDSQNKSILQTFSVLMRAAEETSEKFLENQATKNLLSSNSTFDLVIINWVMSESFTAIAYHFNAPVIAFSPIAGSPYINNLAGNSAPYAYVPQAAMSLTEDMTFFQRVLNTIVGIAGNLALEFWLMPHQRKLLKKHFPGAPPLEKLLEKVDLCLVNAHFVLESPRPYVPNMIPIGGFYLEEEEDLPMDIKEILDRAERGVIFMSLGSNIKSSELAPEKLSVILEVFAKVGYQVLWKFEGELPYKSANVHVRKWYPQKGILGHRNTKIFISHGGLGSLTEAIYFGVPIIGIPFFGDQTQNVADAVRKGIGVEVKYTEMDEDKLRDAIQEIGCSGKYHEEVQKLSSLFREQPLNPMDKAIFWVEHVIKHKGAKHLKPKANSLHLYQYLLLDVVAFLLGVVLLSSWIIFSCVKWIFRCIFTRRVAKLKTI